MKTSLRIHNPTVLSVAMLALLATGVSAQSDEVLKLDIKPQNADSALVTLAKSSGVQIILADGAGADVEVEGLQGEYRFDEALAALTTEAGLTHEYTAENLVVVQEAEQVREPDAADEAPAEEEEAPIELGEQRVTGSRLTMGDPTVRVFTLTAEDIRARGVTTVEELFRTLPFAYAGTTTQNNDAPVGAGDTEDFRTGGINVGISTVNLRALGSANTLVLLNGRRTAGVAGVEDNYANLVNVPLSAIERVDIQLDGSSAVYGADAIGGVVNFITKKNYTGATFQVRDEYSSTDANASKVSFQGGYGWGSGQITAVLSRDSSQPITNEKNRLDQLRPSRPITASSSTPATTVWASRAWCVPHYFSRLSHGPYLRPSLYLPTSFPRGTAAWEPRWTNSQRISCPPTLLRHRTASIRATRRAPCTWSSTSPKICVSMRISCIRTTYRRATRIPRCSSWPVPASNAFNPYGRDRARDLLSDQGDRGRATRGILRFGQPQALPVRRIDLGYWRHDEL